MAPSAKELGLKSGDTAIISEEGSRQLTIKTYKNTYVLFKAGDAVVYSEKPPVEGYIPSPGRAFIVIRDENRLLRTSAISKDSDLFEPRS